MSSITRREALKKAAAGSAAAGASALLAACDWGGESDSSSSATSPSGSSGTPQRGGTINTAVTGGSSSDTLHPLNPVTGPDAARTQSLFDPLATIDSNGKPRLVLADEITPNAAATEWTIRVRQGIEFHDGKELTADDVIHTFQTILDPKAPGIGATALASVDAARLRALDKYTVRVPCKQPFAIMLEALSLAASSRIIPQGFDPKRPIGTGPFEFRSFTAGRESVFERFPNYWQEGQPYADRLVITNYDDETSQVNALLGGQANVASLLSSNSLETVQESGNNILISPGGGFNPFTMRVDQAPFDDVRVRQALRLVVDRKQMMDTVFGGHGTIGNDIYGIWSRDYDHSLPQREQDIEQAASLLAEAGQSDLRVELVTADIAQGSVRSAEVLAQQASEAGITIELRRVTPTELYGDNYLRWTFAQDFSYYNFYLPEVALLGVPGAPYNETHFAEPTYTRLYEQALRTVDDAKRREIAHEMQQIDYERGGLIIPLFVPVIDGYSDEVHGLEPSKSGQSLNSYNFGILWLS